VQKLGQKIWPKIRRKTVFFRPTYCTRGCYLYDGKNIRPEFYVDKRRIEH